MIAFTLLHASLAFGLTAADLLPNAEPPSTMLESYGAVSSTPRDDRDKTVLFLGGILHKDEDDTYRRLMNSGGNPDQIAGPERIYVAQADGASVTGLKPVFQQDGYHVNDPSSVRPNGSKKIFLYFTRGSNKTAEICRKKDDPLRLCAEYAAAREIGLATSEDEGQTWKFERVVVEPKNSGDGSGAGQPGALYVGDEVWLYYTTGNPSFMKENIFRLRLSLDGTRRLGEPQPVHLKGHQPGNAYENVQLVMLKCEDGTKFVSTLVANNRQQTSLLFYLSDDGLNFKPSPNGSLVPYAEHSLASPTQMPGPASVEECSAANASGITTFREIFYSEQANPVSWLLKRARLRLNLP